MTNNDKPTAKQVAASKHIRDMLRDQALPAAEKYGSPKVLSLLTQALAEAERIIDLDKAQNASGTDAEASGEPD
ncbi:hypothetical protein [Terrihabitans sp. B22-R8]|uniref:hypothetical protein n=1 Tax=Terrihabitans sp. B22-R8 TaxID=3425128 RepID=UPI00403C38F3